MSENRRDESRFGRTDGSFAGGSLGGASRTDMLDAWRSQAVDSYIAQPQEGELRGDWSLSGQTRDDASSAEQSIVDRSLAEQSRVDRSRTRMFAMILMAVFFLTLMVGLGSGVAVYGAVANAQSDIADTHLSSGYLANIVRMNDRADAVKVGKGPEGPALVLVETLSTGSYETRIYHFAGSVVQEYAIAGRAYNPENAVRLFDSESFEFELNDGLLTMTTDEGSQSVALRSWQEACS